METIFTPRAGDIVFAWMPESEQTDQPGPKFRPVLILECSAGQNGQLQVLVAYGTSQHTNAHGLGEFTVHPCPEAPLNKPTKFSLLKRMRLPLEQRFFADQDGFPHSSGAVPVKTLGSFMRACQEAGLI